MNRLLRKLGLIALVQLLESVFLITLSLELILLFLEFLIQLLDNLIEFLHFFGVLVSTG